MLQCVAVCCSVLQCSMLQYVAVCCSVEQLAVLQCVAVCCSVLQCVAAFCSVLQYVPLHCSVLQCVAELAPTRFYASTGVICEKNDSFLYICDMTHSRLSY